MGSFLVIVVGTFCVVGVGLFVARLFAGSRRSTSDHGGSVFRLAHFADQPSVYIEAEVVVADLRTYVARRGELAAYLRSLADRPDCAGSYADLVREMDDALDRLGRMSARHEHADMLDVASHLRMRVRIRLREHFDHALKSYGVQLGELTRCVIGASPPDRSPIPAPSA